MTETRRRFLALAAAAPLAALIAAKPRAATPAACVDPAALTFRQKSLRRSMAYIEPSGDPAKHCGTCAFFSAGSTAGCGTCQILGGGTVSAAAICSSFAAKAKP